MPFGCRAPGGPKGPCLFQEKFHSAVFAKWIFEDFPTWEMRQQQQQQQQQQHKQLSQVPVYCASRQTRHSVCLFGVEDLKPLIRLPHFHVNKFDMNVVEPLALQCLEEWRWNNTRAEMEAKVKATNPYVPMIDSDNDDDRVAKSSQDEDEKYHGVDWTFYAKIKRMLWQKELPCGD